jgi:ubiquinone/menaquinone biosynthesis C-methylase UbiE
MDIASYKEHWNRRANTPESAVAAVDGSTSESVVQLTGRWAAEQVSLALDIHRSDRVLELGCGVGRIGRELADSCAHWCGVDISENMISVAAERLRDKSNVSFHQLTRSSLEMIEDDSIDKAYSIAVFCHMDKEDLYLYMQELNRVVKPAGMIFVETWNLSHPVGWRRWAYEPKVWNKSDQTQRKDVARNQFCTPEEFELYVNQAGFRALANFNQSQSVQIIAGNQLSDERKEREKERIEADRGEIAYSPLYAELFGQFVDVIFGKIHATDMLRFIDQQDSAPEVALFRPYLLSLWDKNSELWGDLPD